MPACSLRRGYRPSLARGSALALIAGLAGAPAFAQGTVDAANPARDDIVVVAQKREQRLQDVPIAITAFSEERLDAAQIEDATDLQFSIPNAVLTGNDRLTLRGIGNNAISSTADNGVGTFINGAAIGYLPQNEFFDLERIEVLRGPQGTLYGRNTTGGAVNVITAKPAKEFAASASLQVGNFESIRVGGMLNAPISEAVKLRIAGYFLTRDGYTENLATGSNIDGRDQWAVRASARMDLTTRTSLDLSFGYFEEGSTRAREAKRLCTADPVLGCSPLTLGFDSPNANTTILQTLARFFTPFPAGGNIYANAPNPRDLRQVAADRDPTFTGEQFYWTADFSHSFGDLTFTSVTGYNWSETEQNTDWDNAALPFRFTAPITYNVDRTTRVTTDRLLTSDSFTGRNQSWSQELRLASDFEGPFNFTLGAFYLDSKGAAAFEIWHPAIERFQIANGRPLEAWRVSNTTPLSTTQASALFGEGYLALSDTTRLTLGARYTEEEKAITTRSIVLTGVTPFINAASSWENWTGKAGIDHKTNLPFSDETLLYATLSSGFKSGGLNPGSNVARTFEPETVTAFEVGAKNTVADGALAANFGGFYYDYADLQLGQRISGGAVTRNADATVWGVEGELTWAPTSRWLLSANVSHLNTEIGSFLTVDAANPAQSLTATSPERAVDLSGNELPHSPEFKVNFGAEYTIPDALAGWTAVVRADALWQSEYFAREYNIPTDTIDAWGILDMQARLISPDDRLELRAFVKNVTDEDNITNIIIEDALIGRYRNARILEPRTFGVIVSASF
jgi:outer membrane receptor protein involved in Fe transport